MAWQERELRYYVSRGLHQHHVQIRKRHPSGEGVQPNSDVPGSLVEQRRLDSGDFLCPRGLGTLAQCTTPAAERGDCGVEIREASQATCELLFLFLSLSLFILRERKSTSRGGTGGGERIPSRLRTASTEPDPGLELPNHEIRTGAEIKSRMPNPLSHSGAPGAAS